MKVGTIADAIAIRTTFASGVTFLVPTIWAGSAPLLLQLYNGNSPVHAEFGGSILARHRKPKQPNRQIIGWREWVSLPELSIHHIKAKIDTGARSSALHASSFTDFELDGRGMVQFRVHPIQRPTVVGVDAVAPLFDERPVRNSGGRLELRRVIHTDVALGDQRWPIELTLTNRDAMGFRLLLGRQAVRNRFVVDAGRSFLIGDAPPKASDDG